MIEVDDAVKYFGSCKAKHLKRFQEVTPEGNHISGWICRKPNRYLGSLLIDTLGDKPHEQFVQSMPKIQYFNDERDICLDTEICGEFFTDAIAYEKLDGSCLITYPILDNDGNISEIVPKTRGRAVADKYFIEMFNKVDKSAIWEYYKKNRGILFFEMYGILNQHDIIHYQTGIDIALIGCYEIEFARPLELWFLSVNYGFRQPDNLFRISKNSVDIITDKYCWYFKDVRNEDKYTPTITDSVNKIQEFLEYLNKPYNDMYGRYATEGVVVNCTNVKGEQKYIKIKPRDIENKHKSEKGIPRRDIVKEVLKYFDDFGSEVEEIYKENRNHHTEYLHRMLSEDYPMEYIEKSKKKIERIFMQIWENRIPPISIHKLCDELYDSYPDHSLNDLMRVFADEYPQKKKYANTVYGILKKKFKRNDRCIK